MRTPLLATALVAAAPGAPVESAWSQPSPTADAAMPLEDTTALGLGMNLNEIDYFSPEWVFVDAMKQSKKWHLENIPGSDASDTLDLTRTGYPLLGPGQRAATLMFRDVGGHYPGGYYLCTWKGTGVLEFKDDADLVSLGKNSAIVHVTPSHNGVRIRINQSDPADWVRDIRFVMPGYDDVFEDEPFHPLFLDRLRGFRVLRFMGWMRTNDSSMRIPKQLGRVSYATQVGSRGVAPYYIAELCNAVGADPWVCIPHQATDELVRAYAEALQRTLHPDRLVYVEYSNEVWNFGFDQREWVETRAEALDMEWYELYVERSVEVFKIFEDVFGSHERLVRLVGSQAVNPTLGALIVGALPEPNAADALAIAPYYGHSAAGVMLGRPAEEISIKELLDAAEADRLAQEAATLEYVALAEAHGLRLVAYEGGQHITTSLSEVHDEGKAALLIAANRHPRMEQLYLDDLRFWAEAGGGLFTAFKYVYVPKKWGAWGLLEHQAQHVDDAPKFRAVQRIVDEWTDLTAVDALLGPGGFVSDPFGSP